MHDTVIIGGGPAGLSAALNGAAEGLSTLLLERAPLLGGQAATSSRIENYLGWPNGVDGESLTGKAVRQATRLGATIKTSHQVTKVEHDDLTGFWLTECAAGERHLSRTVILASGVDYRRLKPEQDPEASALYGAPAASHSECEGHPVVVIGGGNSAGQAALNLARIGADVTLLVRRPLTQTMSNYLVERIALDPRITARKGEVDYIGKHLVHLQGDAYTSLPAFRVFAYIGMTPRTAFVNHCCTLHDPGYVEANDYMANENGLFVAGDVREGSFKRVAAAVGEGAIAAAKAWAYIYNRKA